MRISVEIDEATLAEVLRLTGERGKGPALAKAALGFVRRERAREFGRLIRQGAFDYEPMVAEGGSDPGNPLPPLEG